VPGDRGADREARESRAWQDRRMKAAVLNTIPGPLDVENITIDKPGPREVLIRTVAAGLCHSDLHVMEGLLPNPVPVVMGHESAGVVEAVGSDVAEFKAGDHVITCLSVFCGSCRNCLTGHSYLCTNRALTMRAKGAGSRLSRDGTPLQQFANLGGFAEEMLVHENAVVKVTPDMPLDRAALVGCGVMTGFGAVTNEAKVEAGATVAVVGCGGIGLSAVQGAALSGASRVIAVDVNPLKLKFAEQMGATDLVDASQVDPIGAVKDLTDGGVDYAFECIGLKQTAEQVFYMIRQGGMAYIVGVIPQGVNIELPGLAFLGAKGVRGVNMGSNRFKVDMPRLCTLYLQGRLKLDEMISARIKIEDVNRGYEAMKAGEVARSVIMFE